MVTTEEWKVRHTNGTRKSPGKKIVKDIKYAMGKLYSSEDEDQDRLGRPTW